MSDHYIVYESLCGQVALAAFKREYLDSLMPWVNDPEATAGVMLEPPVVFENEVEWFDEMRKSRSQDVFAILYRAVPSGEYRYVGHTGLHQVTFPDARGVTGTFIGDPEARGKEVGKKAKLLLLNHAFMRVGLRKVCSEVKSFNLPSVGHLVACGYEVVGVRKDHHFYKGDYVDQVLLEVHRDAFEPIWAQYQESKEAPTLSEAQKAEIKKLFRA